MLTRFSLGCQRQKGVKIRAGRPARIFTAINASDIDVRRFQGVFFDKGAARFNRIAHQRGEQLIGSDGVLTVTRSMRRLSGSMVVSHSCSGFISPRPL